jgi:uncharacterized protein
MDTSALFKLAFDEPETGALRARSSSLFIVSSELTLTELGRAAARRGVPGRATARVELNRVDLIPVSTAILELAASLAPPLLRTLDAIHLATVVLLGRECDGLFTYDVRMQQAGRLAGIAVEAPGQLV